MQYNELVELPKNSIVHITIHPPNGMIPERIINFFSTEKIIDITPSRKAEHPKYIETRGTVKYGKMDLVSAFGFNPDGTQRPIKYNLPSWLEKDIKSGKVEVHLFIDTRIPPVFSKNTQQKISSVIQKRQKHSTNKT